jgi:hypothetical protein
MADTPKAFEDSVPRSARAQTDIATAVLREDAVNALLQEGREGTYETRGRRTAAGLQLDTENKANRAERSVATISGSSTAADEYSVNITGDFRISKTSKAGSSNLTAHYENVSGWSLPGLSPSRSPYMIGTPSTAVTHNAFSFKDGERLVQDYRAGQYYSANESLNAESRGGQSIRVPKLSVDALNCAKENMAATVDQNSRMECQYIFKGPSGKDYSFMQSREQHPAGTEHRGVIRDMQGKVVGIVDQFFKLDAQGDLVSATTQVRKPRERK